MRSTFVWAIPDVAAKPCIYAQVHADPHMVCIFFLGVVYAHRFLTEVKGGGFLQIGYFLLDSNRCSAWNEKVG